MSKYVDCCPPTCPNAKCRGTGSCMEDLPVVEAPSLAPQPFVTMEKHCLVHCGDRCDCQVGEPVDSPNSFFHGEAYFTDGENPAFPTLMMPNDNGGYTPVTVRGSLAPNTPRTRVIDADSAVRKTYPMAAGLLDYFPDALAEVSKISYLGNQKHNPGEPMHHARGKSMDHADCIIRHLIGRGGFDGELRESAALAWRALALLQEELERELDLPLPRGAKT